MIHVQKDADIVDYGVVVAASEKTLLLPDGPVLEPTSLQAGLKVGLVASTPRHAT